MADHELFYVFKHDSKVWVVPAAAAVLTLNAADGTSRVALCADENQVIDGIRKVDMKPGKTVEAAARCMYVDLRKELAQAQGAAKPAAAGGAE